MPIYKGAVEVTSGNLYKGSTEIENAYKGSDSLFVNEVTLTIAFVDSTAADTSLNSTTSVVMSGSPGSAFSSFTRTVNRANGTIKVTGATVTEIPSLSNVTSTVSGTSSSSRTITFSGTFNTTETITMVVGSTTQALTARTGGVGFNLGSPTFRGNSVVASYSWTGGGTASFPTSSMLTGNGPGVNFASRVRGGNPFGDYTVYNNGVVVYFSGGGSAPSSFSINSGASVDVQPFYPYAGQTWPRVQSFNVNVPESSTHQAFSTGGSFTWN